MINKREIFIELENARNARYTFVINRPIMNLLAYKKKDI